MRPTTCRCGREQKRGETFGIIKYRHLPYDEPACPECVRKEEERQSGKRRFPLNYMDRI